MGRSLKFEATEEVSHRSIVWLSKRIHRFRSLFVLMTFGFLSIVMTWPLVTQLGTHIPSEGQDHLVHLWTYSWVKEALISGQNPFYTTLLYFPKGVSLTTHNIPWLNIAFWLPVQAIIGDLAAASLMYLVIFPLNGFATYLLAKEWTKSIPAAFISGLVYGFWPYVFSPVGRVNLIVLFWLPLALLYLKRTFDDKHPRDAVLCGVFIALGGIARWQLLIISGFIFGLYILYRIATDASSRTKQMTGRMLIIALVALILMAPFALPVALDQVSRTNTEELLSGDPTESQTDLLEYIIPGAYFTFWGKVTQHLPENLQFGKSEIAFIGFTVIALAVYGTIQSWHKARFWVLATLLYLILALGPQLKIGSQLFPQIPMPYRLIDDIYLIQVLRSVHRFNAILGLPIAMLAGFGVSALLDRPRVAKWSPIVTGMLSALILMEYAIIPYSSRRITTPVWYRTLAQEPGYFGVFDLPLGFDYHDELYMFYQRTHGKPLLVGHISRIPQDALSFLESTPFLKGLRPNSVMDPLIFDVSHQLQTLAEANVRYLILHKNRVDATDVDTWRNWLVFEPYHEDDELLVYRTDPQLGRDFELSQNLTGDVGIINARYWPDKLGSGDFLQVDANWGAENQPNDDYELCVQLVDKQGSIAQMHCGPLAPSWPTSHWVANEIVRDHYIMHLDQELPPGEYHVQLALFESSSGSAAGHPAMLGQLIVVESTQKMGQDSRPEYPLDAQWDDLFSILGYDLMDSDDQLSITFHWLALQPTDISYKVFVHLINEASGMVAAQADYIPRNWTYPTDFWQPGEIIRDPVELPLDNVPSGNYRLQFGMYDPDTNQRLEVFSSAGVRYTDDAVYLTMHYQE